MTNANLFKKIRKTINRGEFNIELLPDVDFRERLGLTENVSTADLNFIVELKIYEKDTHIVKYFNDCYPYFSDTRYQIFRKFRERNLKDTSSKLYFRLKYGHVLAKEKFYHKISQTALNPNHPRYREICESKRYRQSLEGYIDLHGVKEGTERWNSFCERNKGNHTLERKIELYGEDAGKRAYEESQYKLKNKNTLEYYKKLYGDKDGEIRYYERNKKNSKSSKGAPVGSELYSQIRKKMEGEGKWIPLEDKSDFEIYTRLVWNLTKRQPLDTLENFNKRGHQRDKGTYAVDHKISIKYGFENNIPIHIIGNIDNLQMLTHSENSSKRDRCYTKLKERNV